MYINLFKFINFISDQHPVVKYLYTDMLIWGEERWERPHTHTQAHVNAYTTPLQQHGSKSSAGDAMADHTLMQPDRIWSYYVRVLLLFTPPSFPL